MGTSDDANGGVEAPNEVPRGTIASDIPEPIFAKLGPNGPTGRSDEEKVPESHVPWAT